MWKDKRRSWGLALAFSGVVIAFVAATLVADWRTFAIDGETESLLGNALPSIEYLGDVNEALRDIEASVEQLLYVPLEEKAALHVTIDARWRDIDANLARYEALPRFEGEDLLFAEVPVALRDFDRTVRATMSEAERGEIDQARIDSDIVVRPRANRMTQLVRQVIRLNWQHAVGSATRIDETRHATVAISALLNVVAVFLTLASATWVLRLVRSHDELLHGRLALERTKSEELEVFGQRVAHDLLSPLSSLSFNLGAFKRASEHDVKLERALARSRECVQRAQQLVDNVFEFARSGGRPSPNARMDVRQAIDEVVAEARGLAADERAEIVVGPVPACAVRCSRGVLESILSNLVRNAVKYMSDSLERRITIRATELGDMVRFQVSDTGPGIPPSIETTLFEPYVRGEGLTQAGLGLGLATVRRFCEAHGGNVDVRSVVGRGSVFEFTLPRASAQAIPAPASEGRPSLGGLS